MSEKIELIINDENGNLLDPLDWKFVKVSSSVQNNTSALIAQIKAISWAPWVKWIAHDKNNVWAAFEEEPYLHPHKNTWTSNGRDSEVDAITIPAFPDWTKSKVKVNLTP